MPRKLIILIKLIDWFLNLRKKTDEKLNSFCPSKLIFDDDEIELEEANETEKSEHKMNNVDKELI